MSQSGATMDSSPNALAEALKGQMPEEHIERLIDDLGKQSPAAISSIMERSKVQIAGDGNIIGNGNVINIKTDNSLRLATILRDAWKQSYALHQLYAPVRDFVGRQPELEKLLTALQNGDSVSISGMSGTGKTQLAMLVADRVREQYPDAQLFVALQGTLDSPRDPAEALEACLRAFVGPEETLPKNIDELRGRYYNLLRDKRALIVLDNAADSKQVRQLLPPPGCALVVTSINNISLPGGSFRISLCEFQPLEARQLLSRIVPTIDQTLADRICYLCGYMPLAIRAAGGFLDESGMDPANYAELLSDERTRLERIDPENIGDLSVEAAFNLSYRRLVPPADRVFCKLAVFQSSFDSAGEEYVCEDPRQWHLSSLEKRSLVLSAVIFDKTKRYRLQNLGKLFADRRLEGEERYVAARRHATHYGTVLQNAARRYHEGGESLRQALNLFDRERDNIRTGQSWAESNCQQDEEAAKLCVNYAVDGESLFNLRGHPKERLNSLRISLACARRLGWRKAECDQLGSIGRAYVELGDFQTAVNHYQEQLTLARELGDLTEEGHALNSLGNAYLRLDPSQAIKLYERALTISRQIHDRQNEGRALNNLGDAYRNYSDFRRAIDFYKQQLEIAREIGDLRSEGNTLNSLGDVYSNLGETRSAIEYLEKSLEVAQEIGTRLGKANVLNNLGNTYLALGEARRAIAFYEQALTMCREIGYSFGEHMTLSGLGEAYVEAGEPRRASGYLETALTFFRSNGGRRGAGNALNNLGKAYADLGEPSRAIKCHEEALGIARELGSRHGEAHVLNDMGEAYAALDEVSRATKLFEQAMTVFKEIGDQRGLCITLNNLGNAFNESGEVPRATQLYEQARDNSRVVGDRRSESIALSNLGKVELDVGQAEDALKLFEQALSLARETGNPRCEGETLFNMGLTLNKIGDHSAAIAQVDAALRIYEQIEHPQVKLVREQLAQWQSGTAQ